jgi:hypothetical protein
VLRFRDRFRKDPGRLIRRFEMCLDCGTTVRVLPDNPRPVGGDPLGPGWVVL